MQSIFALDRLTELDFMHACDAMTLSPMRSSWYGFVCAVLPMLAWLQ